MNKKRKYHHGDLKRTLIDAGLRLIEQRGIGNLNLRELAKRAGVSSGAPYHHFEDRSALLAAIAREGFERLEAVMMSELGNSDADASARLAALGCAYVKFALSNPGYFGVMFLGDVHRRADIDLLQSGGRAFHCLREVVVECQSAKVAPEGDPDLYVFHAWATMHGLADLLVKGGFENLCSNPDMLPKVIASLTSGMFRALAESDLSNCRLGPR